MKNEIERLSLEKIYEGRVANIMHQKVSAIPGKSIEYEFVQRPYVVIVIPILPSKKLLLIRQYRASLNQFICEFPGGVIKNSETPCEAAKRELEEETGYLAHDVEIKKWFYTAPHFTDEKIFVCIASDLICGQPHLQEKEIISTQEFTKLELEGKYLSNELFDAKTLIAYNIIMHDTGEELDI